MRRDRYDRSKVDANQKEIVDALRKIPGVTVEVNHEDFLCGYKGKTFWYECKNPEAVSKKTGEINQSFLKPSQIKLLKEWTGHYRVVTCIEDILEDLK